MVSSRDMFPKYTVARSYSLFKNLHKGVRPMSTQRILKTRAWVMRFNKFKKQTTRHSILILMNMEGLA